MIDSKVETLEAPATNGDREPSLAGEAKATVLARDDAVSGRLQIKGSGQVLGSFSGQIECDGDLFIGPDAHVEADVKSARLTIAGFVKGNIIAVNRLKITNTGRLEGDARPVRTLCRLGQLACPLEAQQARGPLGWQTDLLAESGDDPLAAPTELLRELADPDGPVGLRQALPGPEHAW